MERVKKHLDGLFKNYDASIKNQETRDEVESIIDDAITNYVKEGSTVDEAINKALLNFGDIGEFMNDYDENKPTYQQMSKEFKLLINNNINQYNRTKGLVGLYIGLGIIFAALALTSVIFLEEVLKVGNNMAILTFFGSAALAVPMFIWAGFKTKDYQLDLNDSQIKLLGETDIKDYLIKETKNYQADNKKGIIILIMGIVLAIMSFIPFGLVDDNNPSNEAILACVFITIASIGAAIIVYGCLTIALPPILTKNIQKAKVEEDNPFTPIIYISATAIFLILGFMFQAWHPAWIVYLVATALNILINNMTHNKD